MTSHMTWYYPWGGLGQIFLAENERVPYLPEYVCQIFISSRHSFDMYSFDMYMSKECLDDAKYAFIVLCIAGLHF